MVDIDDSSFWLDSQRILVSLDQWSAATWCCSAFMIAVEAAQSSSERYWGNCNCNWGTCIAPPTRRPKPHHRVNPYPGARRQNETEMFSDHDEMNPSIAAVSSPSVACSMLAVQQQKRLCRQFVDMSNLQLPNLTSVLKRLMLFLMLFILYYFFTLCLFENVLIPR